MQAKAYLCCIFLGILLVGACQAAPPAGGTPNPLPAAQVVASATPIPTAELAARPTYTVQRGRVEQLLEFTGRWQPRDQIQLSFEVAGTVRQVLVKKDDLIAQGQLLADLQITELENQLTNAQLELDTARRNLNLGNTTGTQSVEDAEIALANARLQYESAVGSSPWTQVANAKINVDDAQRALDKAEFDYQEALSRPDQAANGVDTAQKVVDDARSALRTAQINYSQAAQTFNDYEFTIAQRYNSVIQAEIALERARSGQSTDPSREQAVRSAELRIEQLEGQIAQSSLLSPIDGVVLEVTIRPGDTVQAFKAVITLAIPTPLEALANVPIADAQKLSVGLVGLCQVANRPETLVQCVVRQIPASAQDADQTTRVAATLVELPAGSLVEIDMPLQVREDVLWLPPAALRTFQNRTFVVLKTPDGPRSVDVQVGLQTDERVEIIAGVTEGDIVEAP
jgi:multidrug efflux pump subunit AcrA (membrane-fusion protein)